MPGAGALCPGCEQGAEPLANGCGTEARPEGDGTYSLANEALLSRDSHLAWITLKRRNHRHGDKLFTDGE